jgi:hypothetical protein
MLNRQLQDWIQKKTTKAANIVFFLSLVVPNVKTNGDRDKEIINCQNLIVDNLG